jgi:hypothetical protein
MKSNNKCIIPECYIDSCLVEVILEAGNDFVNHQKSNGKVANEMKRKFSDRFCIGIIDEDRKPLDYLKNFKIQQSNDYLRLWRHEIKRNQFIIQIRPVMEKWILRICEENNINVTSEEYKLPDNWKLLIKITKSLATRRDERLLKLFRGMVTKKCLPVIQLKEWINYLRINYNIENLDLP